MLTYKLIYKYYTKHEKAKNEIHYNNWEFINITKNKRIRF